MQKATFQAELLELRALLEWIHKSLKTVPFDSASLSKIELAAEETFVNIVHHSYRGRGGIITVIVQIFADGVEITFQDAGPSFDPLTYIPNFDPMATLEERKIGGLGILFMRQYMDAVRYHHDGVHNCLTLTKKLK